MPFVTRTCVNARLSFNQESAWYQASDSVYRQQMRKNANSTPSPQACYHSIFSTLPHPADALCFFPNVSFSSSLPSSRRVLVLVRTQPICPATNFTLVARARRCAVIRSTRNESSSLDALPKYVATAVTPAIQSRCVSRANTNGKPTDMKKYIPRSCLDAHVQIRVTILGARLDRKVLCV